MKINKIIACTLVLLMVAAMFSACGRKSGAGGTSGTSGTGLSSSASSGANSEGAPLDNTATGDGKVYFLNFKPEQDESYQLIATEYTEKTGVPVKVVTAAAGTYEQQLRSEIAKSDAPTIFQVNGPVGFASWRQYAADITDSEINRHLSDESLAITQDGAVYGIPLAIEGYGIIVNNSIMERYFAMDGAKAASIEDINSFAKLKEVVEDMQAKKDALGIGGVFASTSLLPGEDWRWQTHLSNLPLYYEFQESGADLSDTAATSEITFKYAENFKNIFDLYLNNSTIAPTMVGSKTVNDSMSEFAMGKAAMVQNGNWAYSQVAGVEGNVVGEEDVRFLPIYIGAEGEENQGLAIGTENFFCINKNASLADQKASLEFMNWLYTSEEGKARVTHSLGFIAPFTSFTESDMPSDPLGQQVMQWAGKRGINNVPWNFTIYPSQQFKDDFGSNLLLYAQGQAEWDTVKDSMVKGWAAEKAATAQTAQ